MNRRFNMAKLADKMYLKRLLETPSVTGTESLVAHLVRERLAECADVIETDVMGSVHARLFGNGSAPSVMIAAHMDEVGLMVKSIDSQGFLRVVPVGGVDAAILPGLRVDVHTSQGVIRGVVGRKPIHLIESDERTKVTPINGLFIDLGLSPRKVRETVRVGDVVTYGVGFEKYGKGMAVSRAFDDKAGVYVITRVMEELKRASGSMGDYICAATVQEEIGSRGASTSAFSIKPDVAIALDVTHATDYPGIDTDRYGSVFCGKALLLLVAPILTLWYLSACALLLKPRGSRFSSKLSQATRERMLPRCRFNVVAAPRVWSPFLYVTCIHPLKWLNCPISRIR